MAVKKLKRKFHFIKQGKGGVGKSFVASLIAQYIQSKDEAFIAVDTDPNNATLYSIKALNTKVLELLDENEKFNERNFDKLMELAFANTDKHFVCDNGATSFLPLLAYIQENDILTMLAEHFDVIVHVPVTGGQAQNDTFNGLQALIDNYGSKAQFVVWVNEYHGKIQLADKIGFEAQEVYLKNKDNILAVMTLREQNEKLAGKDLEDMTKLSLTFDEAITTSSLPIMTKQRLKLYRDDVFAQMKIIL